MHRMITQIRTMMQQRGSYFSFCRVAGIVSLEMAKSCYNIEGGLLKRFLLVA